MEKTMFSDKSAKEADNLFTVTATAFGGVARITGQINAQTVREEVCYAVTTQERLDSHAENLLETLKRSATV